MKNSKILVIACHGAGKKENPKQAIQGLLEEKNLPYEYLSLRTPKEITKQLINKYQNLELIIAYGGDGTIVSVMKAMIGLASKLLVLPGGTANIIATELGIKDSHSEILKSYLENLLVVRDFDIAEMPEGKLVVDMHTGWWSDAISSTENVTKKRLGKVAYALQALKQVPEARFKTYTFSVSGKKQRVKGYTLLVANRGLQHIFGLPLFGSKHRQGILQVAVIRTLNPLKLAIWVITKATFNKNLSSIIKTYRGYKVEILSSAKQAIIDDQEGVIDPPLLIRGGRHIIKVYAPPAEAPGGLFSTVKLRFITTVQRYKERLRRRLTGVPRFEVSELSPGLFVGGQYRSSARKTFDDWGVSGIINMRKTTSPVIDKNIEMLHLPTRDWTPPDIDSLKKGVLFIESHLKKDGGVYVHCRLGEGRGPTMAIAYLIYKGLSVEESPDHIKKSRPMARPNTRQVARLTEWQDFVSTHNINKK